MFAWLKQNWQTFIEAAPGERFERLYHRREGRQSIVARSTFLVIGLIIMALGLVLMPAPGPGTVVLLLGAAIAAQESLRIARVMDWAEVRARRVVNRVVNWWRRRSLSSQILLAVAALGITASAGLVGYTLLAAL
jgi:uncharacterized protein (TIGR02611 family)